MFEAPIDLLSYISLCGVGSQALFQTLKDYPALTKICLCLDHDEAGMEAAAHGMEAVLAGEKPPPELVEEKMLQMA